MDLITGYAYPGNVREMMNIMERAVAMCQGTLIQARDLPPDLAQVEVSVFPKPGERAPTLEEWERQYIEHILKLTGGMRARAADILGIDRVSLWRKMKKYDLE
jgi:DNA-binding NtrC family response regulator